MAWYDNLGKMAKSAFDFTGIPGLIHDVATSGSNDDPWYVDAVNVAKDAVKIGTTPVRGAVKGLFALGEASYNVGQTVRTGIVGQELKLPFMYNRYKNLGESYDDYVKRVDASKDQITLGQASLSMFSPGKNAAENSGWFKDFTDTHAQFLSAGFDIFSEADRKAAFEDQNVGKFITGTTDLAAVTFIDPLFVAGVAGKGLSIAARAPMYTSLTGAGETGLKAIPGSLTRAVFGRMAMTTDSMDNLLERALVGEGRAVNDIEFLASADAKSQYGFWEAKKVTHPEAMSFLFGRAQTNEEVVQTFRAVLGRDTKAMAEIAQRDPEAALAIDNMGDLPKPYRDALTGQLDGDLIVNDNYNAAVDTFVSRLAREDDRYRIALEKVATGGQEFRGGTFARGPLAGTARRRAEKYAETYATPEVTLIQETGFHPTVAIVNHAKGVKDFFGQFMPSGVYQVNDGDSYREFNAFLREANKLSDGSFRGAAASFADKYLSAASEGERLNIIQQAEREAVAAIAPGMSQREIDYIYTMYDYRRAKAIQEHKNRGFVSLFTENGPVVAKAAVLERESANVVISMDLHKLKNGIERFEGVLPGVLSGIDATDIAMRSQKFLDTLDTVNDIFKTSVLLRLGYTVRNLGEAQLSLMAKGFALPAVVASGGKDAVARFVNNRKVDFSRAIDHVNVLAGRADDSLVLRREVSHITDQLRALGMSREQLAREVRQRISEYERGVFRPRLVETEYGGMGPLTVEDEIKVLRSALEELESVTLYHGTADSAFAIDRARPLATSASSGTADKYTRVAITRSVGDYMQTPSGRAVKLGNTEATIKNTEQAIKDAEKQIAMAEKEIARSGSTQFDVALLKQTIQENKTILKKSKAKLRSAEKRAESIGEAADNLISDMVDAIAAGRTVEMQTASGWRKVESLNWNQVRLAEEGALEVKPETLENLVFRVRGKLGNVVPVKSYGPALNLRNWSEIPLELRQSLFGNNVTKWNAWNKSKGWQDNQSALFAYLRENGYGRAIVKDDERAAGISHIVLPESTGEQGRLRAVQTRLSGIEESGAQYAAYEMEPVAQKFDTPQARRAARVAAKRAEKSRRKHLPVSPYYDKESLTAMVNNGVEDAAIKLGEDFTTLHAQLDDMMNRLSARTTAAESNRVRQRAGYGYFQYDVQGHTYTLPEAYQNASWFWSRTSAEPTWNAMVGSQQMAFMTGIGSRSMRPVKPNDPRYFEAWAGVLQMHFRDPETGIMDPVVRMILDGKTDDELVRWLTQSRAGRIYANNTYTTVGQAVGFNKMKAGELDEYIGKRVADTRQAVKLYIPDEDTALLLSAADETGAPLSGAEVQNFLMNRFGSNPENLPEINGLLITTSKEYRDQERIIDTVNRRVMRFLGSLPEDTFARHPLAAAVYKDNVKKNVAGIAAAKGTDRLTVDELNRAQSAAREEARREVERTLFTIVRRTGASSSQVMRLLFPFYAAYENTLYRWSGIVGENPAVLTTAARSIADVVHGMDVVDKDGNPVKDASGITGDEHLIVQVPQAFIKSLPKDWQDVMQNAFKSISIPLSSLDVVTQGQPGNPGFGPYAVLPTYLVLRNRPEFEDAFKPLFPAGMPTNASDIFLPSALRRLKTMWTQDAQYVRTYNQMLRWETYNYNSGKRTDQPTASEIQDKTNKFFILRTLTAITAPFAISPEVDFYQQQFRQFQQQYTAPGEAEAKFLEMYPDFFEATVSLSKNIGGLEASQATVKNLRKFSGLMSKAQAAGDPELMGWLANDFDGKYDFSQAAYQWQYRHGSYPGSASTYRQNRNPDELIRDANLKRGWTEYRKLQDEIDAFKIQNGITSNRDTLLDQYNAVKRTWLDIMAQENPDWYAAYMSPDRGKYMRRANVLKEAFNGTTAESKKWLAQNGNRPVVKAVALYLDVRDQIGQTLLQRDQMGGSRSLDANSNEDIQAMWDGFVTQLKAESPEFGDFVNRYFPNDPVVL